MTYIELSANYLHRADAADDNFTLAYVLGCAIVYALLAIATAVEALQRE